MKMSGMAMSGHRVRNVSGGGYEVTFLVSGNEFKSAGSVEEVFSQFESLFKKEASKLSEEQLDEINERMSRLVDFGWKKICKIG